MRYDGATVHGSDIPSQAALRSSAVQRTAVTILAECCGCVLIEYSLPWTDKGSNRRRRSGVVLCPDLLADVAQALNVEVIWEVHSPEEIAILVEAEGKKGTTVQGERSGCQPWLDVSAARRCYDSGERRRAKRRSCARPQPKRRWSQGAGGAPGVPQIACVYLASGMAVEGAPETVNHQPLSPEPSTLKSEPGLLRALGCVQDLNAFGV